MLELCNTFESISMFSQRSDWGQGESARPHRGHHVTERRHWWPEEGCSYSQGVVDADYSLSTPKNFCAWWRATSYERWPCQVEHSGSKGVDLEKQSPNYGVSAVPVGWKAVGESVSNGTLWDTRRPPSGNSAIPRMGALLGGPNCNACNDGQFQSDVLTSINYDS
jgi:hypothetical protein